MSDRDLLIIALGLAMLNSVIIGLLVLVDRLEHDEKGKT